MKTTITPKIWASGGMVDTSVLGTDFFGSEGSSPFSPTTKKVAKIKRNSDYETVYVFRVSYTKGKKFGTVVQGFKTIASLRNYRPSFSFPLAVRIVAIPSLFLNFQYFHLWVVSYTNVYRPPYTALKWLEKKEICSHYVRH